MKYKLLFFSILLSLQIIAQNQNETLNNYSVLNMIKLGLGEVIVKTKIQQSTCNFDLSTDALIFLKNNNVPESIISIMIEKGSSKNSNNQNSTVNVNFGEASKLNKNVDENRILNPKYKDEVEKILPSLFESGIFYYNPLDNVVQKLDPTVVTSNSKGGFGNFMAQYYTLGMANTNVYANLDNKNANLQISNSSPVFYFYFEYQKSSLNNSNNTQDDLPVDNYFAMLGRYTARVMNSNNAVAMSPNDFKLINLEEEKNKRSFISGKSSLYSKKSGMNSKQFEGIKYERLTPTLFRVSFNEQLEAGEYCFYYAGNTNTQSSDNNFYKVNQMKVYDFGINNSSNKKNSSK